MKPLSQKNIKPLDQDNAAPCHECGSVQCAFCSLRINNALLWAKSWRYSDNLDYRCEICKVENQPFFLNPKEERNIVGICKDCLLSRAFSEVTK